MKTSFITATIAIVAIFLLNSCTVTTAPDGTVTREADAASWIRIAELFARDEVPPVAPVVPSK